MADMQTNQGNGNREASGNGTGTNGPAPGRNRPVERFRYGRAELSVWRNRGSRGIFHTASIQRKYHDGEQWRQSLSFTASDMPNLAKAAFDAHSWMMRANAEEDAKLAAQNGGGEQRELIGEDRAEAARAVEPKGQTGEGAMSAERKRPDLSDGKLPPIPAVKSEAA